MFAICPGDGEATPVRCPGGGDAFGEAALTGEVPGDAAGGVAGELPGDPTGAVPGELAGEDGGLAFPAASAGGLETAAPCAAGDGEAVCAPGELDVAAPCAGGAAAGPAPPPGDGDSSGAGARAPMFARSGPIRMFPRNTGRSKM